MSEEEANGMGRAELGKLVAILLFGVALFLAGLIFGMAREEAVWQRAAIHNHAAHWTRDSAGQWIFHWGPEPGEPGE